MFKRIAIVQLDGKKLRHDAILHEWVCGKRALSSALFRSVEIPLALK